MTTKIEWSDESWNPVTGCSPVSPGCAHCYAYAFSRRLAGRFNYDRDDPFRVTFRSDRLSQPRRWKKPRLVFVCSMGDLFHEDVDDQAIRHVWETMIAVSHHTYVILTKRPERMKEAIDRLINKCRLLPESWSHVWLGVSVESQEWMSRVETLLTIPTDGFRLVSCEPLLGPLNFNFADDVCHCGEYAESHPFFVGHQFVPMMDSYLHYLDWVIVGGETGANARPMHPDWARSIRDECIELSVPFFFKSHGKYNLFDDSGDGDPLWMKSTASGRRFLDGVLWEGYPDGR